MSPQHCKLFVGRLNVYTNSNGLCKHFEKYGTVIDCTVIEDMHLQRSRCFGFVTYSTMEEAETAIKCRPHTIDGKTVEVTWAVVREDANKPEALANVKKIFVGGLKDDIEEEHLISHFSQYGDIEKATVISDKDTGKKRGFGFVLFVEQHAADRAIAEKFHNISGYKVEVKKALTKHLIQDTYRGMIAMGRWSGRGVRVNKNGYSSRDYGTNYNYGNGGGYNFGSSYGGFPGYDGGYGDQESGYGGRNCFEFGSGYGQHSSGYGPMKGSLGPQRSSAPYSRCVWAGYPMWHAARNMG
ncbi:heterogeneous nuclear ribonucleoprotein A0-like [Solea solea]|uniref:heterogeneous nuclear ribonucleoprotein A0-like n=1 Tax=Solea solea TaxID=90069 RepID=UPI00272B6B3E|nr:heterogeneous nuclear ribonucleoprotein A0-like [Solea solea]